MDNNKSIQWFPGHMTKAKRNIEEKLKLVDIVIEIIDARIPISSKNPDFNILLGKKPRLILINKCDIADKHETEKFLKYYNDNENKALAIDCKTGKGLNKILPLIKEILKEKIEAAYKKGFIKKDIRIMVVGIPNVGKSCFINKMVKSNKSTVQDRPGVTRGTQWFSIGNGFELLDTPGVLWPKFSSYSIGEKLAFTGAIKDNILDMEELAVSLLKILIKEYPDLLTKKFNISQEDLKKEAFEVLKIIGKKRSMIISGGKIDTQRASIMLIDEFRASKFGKITLEKVNKI